MRVLTVEVKLIKHTEIYSYFSLSGEAIKNRETTICQAFKDLKTDKMINNSISVSFKDISKKEICLKIDNLKPDM